MKVYSIGRETGCDIVINDSTDVISRRHAVLNVSPSGKMTIVDQSHNGTYVNGIRISPNVPVPVTRKDNISFAHVARLDWSLVPKSYTPLHYVVVAIVALFVAIGAVFTYNNLGGGDEKSVVTKVDTDSVKNDSVNVKTKTKADSTSKAKAHPKQKRSDKKATTAPSSSKNTQKNDGDAENNKRKKSVAKPEKDASKTDKKQKEEVKSPKRLRS